MLLAQNATCVNTKDATDGNSFAKYSILSHTTPSLTTMLLGSTTITAAGNGWNKTSAITYCLWETENVNTGKANTESCHG